MAKRPEIMLKREKLEKLFKIYFFLFLFWKKKLFFHKKLILNFFKINTKVNIILNKKLNNKMPKLFNTFLIKNDLSLLKKLNYF